ncbi:C-type lectin domain family 2 member B-like [Manis javanica]|uniref:C-type lectin domain family 2 member B-like n=1 Tax=Manis javanica TaxID=9974 RepID=UPI003C6D192E
MELLSQDERVPKSNDSNPGTGDKKQVKHCWCRQVQSIPNTTQYFCPEDWIGFQNKCYYFSQEEGVWNSSRHNCSTQLADLTVIDTTGEMDFLRRFKSSSNHWIGLEITEDQTAKWINGAIFNKWFNIRGSEKCAYLNDDGVATARCYMERKWICRKK